MVEQTENKINPDLALGLAALKGKRPIETGYIDYYDGIQPLRYSTGKMTSIFKDLDVDFTVNWCAPVIDSTYNRVNITNIELVEEAGDDKTETGLAAAINRLKEFVTGTKDKAADALDGIVSGNEIILESDENHFVAGITGESFYLVEKDDDGIVQGFYNDPRQVHLFYERGNTRKKRFAIKMWIQEDKRVRVTLFYPDRFEFYVSSGPQTQKNQKMTFVFSDNMGNALEEQAAFVNTEKIIPVFHFRPSRRKIKSDLTNVITIQDATNKLESDMMITSEFSSVKQRWIISQTSTEGALKNEAGGIMDIPAGDGSAQDTEVGSFDQSDPSVYLKPIDHQVNAISAITQTPHHLLFNTGTSQISGEALIALEAPLNDKAQARINSFQPVWQEVLSYMLLLAGHKIEKKQIAVIFDDPATIQPKTRSEIRKLDVEAGIPIKTTLRSEGWTQPQLDQMTVDEAEEAARNQASLGAALMQGQRGMDNPEGDVNPLDNEE